MIQISGDTAGKRALTEDREYLRILLSTEQQLEGSEEIPLISNGSVTVNTDIDSTSKVGNGNKVVKMAIIFEQYFRLPDGTIRVTLPGGTQIITEKQLQTVVSDLVDAVNKAADANHEFYKDIVDKAVAGRAKQLDITKEQMLARLKKDGRGLHGDIPPDLNRSDFVPAELHFGCTPGIPILGYCYLATGYVGYNHNARLLDWMKTRPLVLQHEMVHCNPKLQRFPLEVMDFELMASIPEVLYLENTGDLMYHSYLRVLRQLVEVHFGYDFRQAKREMIRFDFAGNLRVDEKKYEENYDILQRIKTDLFATIRDRFVPEVYADHYWWAAMHDRLGDKNGYLRIGMARYYDLAGLDGRQKTMEWLETHKDKIQRMADRAFEKTEQKDDDTDQEEFMTMSSKLGIPKILLERYADALSQTDKQKLSDFLKGHEDSVNQIRDMISQRKWRELNRFIKHVLVIQPGSNKHESSEKQEAVK